MKRALIAALVASLFVVSLGTAQDADTTMTKGSMTHETSMSGDMGSGATVAEMVFCTSVQDRQPIGEADTFGDDVGSVTCFTRITGVDGESSVTHVWYHGDEEMGRVELPVRASTWRTWSAKTILPEATGQWRVDVLSAGGDVLKSATFTVGASSGM
jgi:Protein of unknown function (DUF2914)